LSLEDLARDVEQRCLEPQPRSARQERLEHLVASYL
jgi:xylose isomerase